MQEKAVRVFLDVTERYQEYIKTEIPFVNYVRDRKEGQVHIMLTQQRTGSGGTEYTLTFIGQQNFTGEDDTLRCVSQQMDTEEIIRQNIVKTIKVGLVRYVSKTPLVKNLSINYMEMTDPTSVVDKWNYWVFNTDTSGRLNAEESSKDIRLNGSFSADRVTPDWKISLYVNANYNKEEYKTDERTISSYTRAQNFQGLVVKSRGEHWSTGIFGSARSSVFSNTKFSYTVAPAIEYNVFPYSESTRREFRFLYRAGYNDIQYDEITLYDKTHEHLFEESLSGTFEIKEKWGSVSTSLEGSHYFHDFSKNELMLHCEMTFRLFEGFSLNLHGLISRIHNQLSLPKEGATEEEILLHQKQLATQYDYFASIGLRYTFGSIYSNVVNPRFGGGN
ncbi:hypothetical protein ACFL2X_01765 [Candidatus Latescibacterota bacterium]